MNRGELRRYVGSTGHTLGHVEKDYLQHIVLAAYSRKMAGHLVFKGGTALQKLGVVARFSEDLECRKVFVVPRARSLDMVDDVQVLDASAIVEFATTHRPSYHD